MCSPLHNPCGKMAFRGSGTGFISLGGNSGGHKLLSRLRGMFLTAVLWVSVAVSYLAKSDPTLLGSHGGHDQPQTRLSMCPSAPESQPWRCAQENPTPGIPVPSTSRFSKVFICLKLQKNIRCTSFGGIHRNTSAVWFWSLTSSGML